MATNKVLKSKRTNKLINMFFIFIILIMGFYIGVSSTISQSTSSFSANALQANGITKLTTNGLVYGNNNVRLGGVTTYTKSGSSAPEAGTGYTTITQTSPTDLYISGRIATNKGKGGFLGSAGNSNDAYIKNIGTRLVFESYPNSTDSDINISSKIAMSTSLVNAIKDPMLTVTANAYFTSAQAPGDPSAIDYADVTLEWRPNGEAVDNENTSKTLTSALLNGTRNTGSIAINSIGNLDKAYLYLVFDNIRQAQIAYGESGGWFGSGDDYASSAIGADISQIYIAIDITMNSGLAFRSIASNNNDITITDPSGIRDANCAKDIVKSGDIIEVKTNMRYSNQNLIMSYAASTNNFYIAYEDEPTNLLINAFRDFFIKPYDENGNSVIEQWELDYLKNISTIEWEYPELYLSRIIDNEFDITGQTAKFLVGDLPAGVITSMQLRPLLRKYEDGMFSGLNKTASQYLVLRGDSTSPEDPEISAVDAYRQEYLETGKWYSKGFTEGPDSVRGVNIEVNMSPQSFLTGNGASQRIYYTTDGSNPITSSTRRVLVENITSSTQNYKVNLYFPMPNPVRQRIYNIRFVSYDYAGNISPVVPYDNVKIDCTDYFINLYFVQGEAISSTPANSSSVAMLGTAELGIYRTANDKDYRKLASRAYRRGELAYIQLTVRKASQYRLFQYYNSGIRSIVCDFIDYGDFDINDYGDFKNKSNTEVKLSVPNHELETAIELTDDMVSNQENLKFYFFFKQRLPIMIGSTEAIYDGTEKGIEQPTTIYSKVTNNIVTYYKKNIEDEFISTARYTNAGIYYYKCEIVDGDYFGEVKGIFTIKKADPYIKGLEVQDIIYENSMESAIIRCQNTNPDLPDILYNGNSSSDGKVAGNFRITDPTDGTAYIRPTRGTKDITVTFYPSLAYESNYNAISFQTKLVVNYATNLEITFQEATFAYTYQKDTRRYASAITNPGSQQLIYEYKREGENDTAYNVLAPIDAGIYEVRVRTDLNISNYDNMRTTEGTPLKLVINRLPVTVEPTPAVCYYQNDFDPLADAYLITGAGSQYIPIYSWRYEYSVNGVWVATRPTDYGTYNVKVIINSMSATGEIIGNYVGEAETTLTIKKGNADTTTSFSIVYPTPINNPSINGHISYGQRLIDINLTTGTGYKAVYMFKALSPQGIEVFEARTVNGEFLVANRLYNSAVDTSIEAFVTEMKNKILPVNRYTGGTALYMTFVPNDRTNFSIVTSRVNITIVKATPSFGGLSINNLVYGNIAADLIINGFAKQTGTKPTYSISEEVYIDDILVNPTVNGIPINGILEYMDQDNKILAAGTQKVLFRFTPTDLDNIKIIPSIYLNVIVEKALLELELAESFEGDTIERIYGNMFRNPAINIYKIIGDARVLDNSYNTNYVYHNSVGTQVLMNTLSPSGVYSMEINIVNNNYQGFLTETIEIIKATPILHTAPLAGTVKYGMDMSSVILSNGRMQHSTTYVNVEGQFTFNGVPPIPNRVGEIDYAVIFNPTNSTNYNSVEMSIRIRVSKANATISLSDLVHTYNGEVQNPSYATNIVKRTDGEDEFYINLDEGNEFTEFDRNLSATLTYSTSNGAIPTNAGTYSVTAKIVDDNFEGQITGEYIIHQASATIIIEQTSRLQSYNSGTISLRAFAQNLNGQSINVLISQSFSNYINTPLQEAPRDVGIYNVYLEIRDTNYKGTATSTLTVTVTQLTILNNFQTYGTKPPIIVDYLPSTASAVLRYRPILNENGDLGDVTEAQPTNAGKYQILIIFPANTNNGFSITYESELTISKAQVDLAFNGIFTYNYIGNERPQLAVDINNIRVYPSPLYTLKRYAQFYDIETEQFTSIEPINVGSYIMKVIINDNNYAGSEEFVYTIQKATPTIRMNPVVSPLIFTDDGSDAVIVGGEVVFNGITKPGVYQLIENTMNLEVGNHNVRYMFSPTDSLNLKEIYGIAVVTIMQKDLSEKIVFEGDISVQYNQNPHYITAYIATGERVIIEIFYNRSKSAPRERGTYTVTAEVLDKNYKGTAEWNKKLSIIVGMPVIVPPKLTNINVGNPLSYSEIQGGYAYIKGTGQFVGDKLIEGTATLIPGVFAFTRPSTEMNEANYRDAELSFKPFASNNFSNVSFITQVKVIGTPPTIGTVKTSVKETGKTIYYGETLRNFNIFFQNTPVGATSGTLSFIDEDTIPKVGEKVGYRFYPDNDTVYNIIDGEVEITISKTVPSVQTIKAKAFFGQTLSSAVFSANMQNQYNTDTPVDGEFQLISVSGYSLDTILTANQMLGMSYNPLSGDIVSLNGRYRFVSDNYTTIEGDIVIECFHLVDEANIQVHNFSKSYNALPITARDLNISTSFTQHPIFEEDYIISIFDNDGKVSQGTAVGSYIVIVEINDIVYYGKKTISFTIDKVDISSDISLSYYSATFGDAMSKPNIIVVGEYGDIAQSNFTIEFKSINENNIGSYNETMPSQAGAYDVRVSVQSNPYFTAQKQFIFTIEKKSAAINVTGMIQNFGNVNPLNVISVEYDLVPTVTYYSSVYNRTTIVPTEAGDYTARVEIIHNNYTVRLGQYNYVEASFKILQATLILRTRPVVSDIIYGQSYADCKITGGQITFGDNVTVLGKYSFQNPNTKPIAGIITTSIVFTPYNKNFAVLRIEDIEVNVLRANTEIIFTNLTAIYDGTNKKGNTRYVGDNDVSWEIIFKQQGNIVQPINAGTYDITVRILSPNHQLGISIQGEPIIEKANIAAFVINKATVQDFILPVPTPIIFGQSLAYSTLNSSEYEGYGIATYANIAGYINGSFSYINSGLVLGNSGSYVVDIVFNPDDSNNHNSFLTKITVQVAPAPATITVSNNIYTYGTPITLPTFVTNPGNLKIDHNMDCLGSIMDAGIYVYRVWIISNNYDDPNNFFDFNIEIRKKEVILDFVQDGERVEKYFTSYKLLLQAKANVRLETIVAADLYSSSGVHINQRINITYQTVPKDDNIPVENIGHSAPSNIGDYRVIAVMDHPNYYGTSSIYYDVNLGELEEIYFDVSTLEQQVYGSVVPPIITTKPAGVAYWIDYQGFGKIMPTTAGTYNIIVYFNDSNFVPRHISAMFKIQKKEIYLENIVVEDKVYDGVATMKINAKMNGVLLGDEVNLSLKARTEDGNVKVGSHHIEITSYTISGLSANNYYLARPYIANTAQIFERKIADANSESFITSKQGFSNGVTVEFKEIESPNNKENFFTNLLGQKATVQTFQIKENGLATTLDEKIKVYVKIPDKYLEDESLKITGLGALAGRPIIFTREGDYYTFDTDSSGEVAFSSNDFSYWSIPAASLVVIVILGIAFLFWLNPRHRKGKTGDTAAEKAATQRIKKGLYK